jgi:hypothetical protein
MSAEKIISNQQNSSNLVIPKVNEGEFSGRVDINKLIARVRREEKEENKTNLVIFGLFAALIVIIATILSF